MAFNFHITRYRGNSIYGLLTVRKNGVIVNLTGKELFFTGKLNRGDLGTVFQKSLSDGILIINAALGTAQVRVAPEDTSDLTILKTPGASGAITPVYCDCEIKDPSLNDAYTVSAGIIDLVEDLTRI